jgi:2-polyprenyl-3-methyl-5-hydroxy-6-metoxy-1,4-benzoquinol methylase
MQRVTDQVEILDRPITDVPALRGALRDLARINRLLGGLALSRTALVRLVSAARRDPAAPAPPPDWSRYPLRLLDVGTGGADIPAGLLRWTDRHGRQLEIEGIDATPETVDAARAMQHRESRLTLRLGDGRSLPYPSRSFDVTHCSLVFHHLTPDDGVALLAEMGRVARLGVIVNDLDRGRLFLLFALLLGPVFTRNRVTRADGPLSVRRAYHPDEIAALAERAGLRERFRVRGFIGHRWSLVFAPLPASAAVGPGAEA